jgi:hypothetical protein
MSPHALEQRSCQLARADDALGMVLCPETRLFTIAITLSTRQAMIRSQRVNRPVITPHQMR